MYKYIYIYAIHLSCPSRVHTIAVESLNVGCFYLAGIWTIRCVYIDEGFQQNLSLPECVLYWKILGCPAASYVWLLKVTLLTSRFKTTSLPSLSPWWGLMKPDLSRNSYLVGEGRKLIRNTMELPKCLNETDCKAKVVGGDFAIAVFQIQPRWHKNASRSLPGWSRNESKFHTQHATTEAAGCCNASLFVFEGVKVDGNPLPNGRWITRIGYSSHLLFSHSTFVCCILTVKIWILLVIAKFRFIILLDFLEPFLAAYLPFRCVCLVQWPALPGTMGAKRQMVVYLGIFGACLPKDPCTLDSLALPKMSCRFWR